MLGWTPDCRHALLTETNHLEGNLLLDCGSDAKGVNNLDSGYSPAFDPQCALLDRS